MYFPRKVHYREFSLDSRDGDIRPGKMTPGRFPVVFTVAISVQ